MENVKVVIYSRVSTTVQDYERQISDCQAYCQNNGYIIVKSFQEKESGKKKVRKELTAMLNYFKSNTDVKQLTISELSRLGRTNEVLNTIETLNKLGVNLHTLKDNRNTLKPDGSVDSETNLFMTIMSGINSSELITQKYRVSSGLLQSAKIGHAGGSAVIPYGFYKDDKKMLLVDEGEAVTVRQIFEMSLSGKGTRVIATYLNNKGIKPRKTAKFRDITVYRMLKNTLYKGERNFKGHVFEVEKIVDNDLFDKVQTVLSSNANSQGINKKFNYLFDKQLIECGVCHKSYFGYKKLNKGENVYKCLSTKYAGEGCGNRGINIDKLEKSVCQVIIKRFPNMITSLTDTLNFDNDLQKFSTELEESETFLKKLIFRENGLIDSKVEGDITKEQFREKVEPIRREQLKLNNRISDLNGRIKRVEHLKANKLNIVKIAENWKEKGNDKSVVRSLIDGITVFPTDARELEEREICLSSHKLQTVHRVEVYISGLMLELFISQRSNNYYFRGEYLPIE